MKIGLCPGSYDPVTNGHIDIIRRSTRLFQKVIVVVADHPEKTALFTLPERLEMLHLSTQGLPNVEVDVCPGLVADYARQKNACAVIKGLQAVSDFDREFQIALVSKKLNPSLETLFLTTSAQYMYLSSQAVREIGAFKGNLSAFVPAEVEKMVFNKLAQFQKSP